MLACPWHLCCDRTGSKSGSAARPSARTCAPHMAHHQCITVSIFYLPRNVRRSARRGQKHRGEHGKHGKERQQGLCGDVIKQKPAPEPRGIRDVAELLALTSRRWTPWSGRAPSLHSPSGVCVLRGDGLRGCAAAMDGRLPGRLGLRTNLEARHGPWLTRGWCCCRAAPLITSY